jgi:plastocyanin
MRKFSILLFIVLVCMTIVCGCSVPSPSPSQPAAPASKPAAVQSAAPVSNGIVKNVYIEQRAFDPDIITISAGTTVTWTNEDPISHRVVHLPELPADKELFHSEPFSKGESFSYTFQTAGRYYYSDPQYAGGRKSLVIVQ